MSGMGEPNFWKSSIKEFWESPLGPLYDHGLIRKFGESDPLYGPTLEKSVEARRNIELSCCYVGGTLALACYSRLNGHLIGKISARSATVEFLLKGLAVVVVPPVIMHAGVFMGVYVGNRWHKLSGQNAPEAEAKYYEWLQNRASAEYS